MVVDPDSDFRNLVHDTAKAVAPACRIQSAADGAIALQMIKEFRPHVLVIDLSLPHINGLEVVATLRGDPEFSDIEVIVTSKRGGTPEAAILSSLNVGHFLTKPVDIDTLASVLLPALEHPVSLLRR
jgi:CheY-like chemotaxis protein